MKKILFLWATLLSLTAFSQVTLTGSSYTQNFDGIGSGLPTGWTVRTGATSISRGTAQTFTNTATSWSDSGGRFKNLASANSLASSASNTDQSNSTDRALGVRQSGTFGDPGASFELEISNTTGKTNFSLALRHQMLSVQGRSTIWSVQYSTNGGTNWTLLDTYNDPSSFGSTSVGYSFGSALDNINSTVLIRVVALTASTGSGSRDTYGIDDFSLTWSAASSPTISSSVSTLTGFSYLQGFGPSTSQNFTISASNLNPVAENLTITAPANFEVSNDNTNWSSSFTMAYSSNGTTISNNNVYVRLADGLSAGNYNGNISIGGGSASIVNVSVSGEVNAPNFISLDAVGTPYTQDFNTLPNTGTGHALSTLPTGWSFFETGSAANTSFDATDGFANSGNTFSFGIDSDTDRAFGALQSGSLTSTWGAEFVNNTGETINNLAVSYTGETWRVGSANRSDRIEFVYSTDATALNNGTWTAVTQLNYENPGQPATGNSSLQHSANISHTITGLNIADGETLWIRWIDFNASGADDGMGVDDFSIVVPLAGSPLLSLSEASLTGFCANSSASASQSFNFEGSDLSPASGTIQVSADNNDFEFSTDNTNFANALNLNYSNGEISSTVFVRLKGGLTLGNKTATLTVDGGGDSKNLSLGGESSAEPTLAVGDISIIGHRTGSPDQLTFVTWVDLPANTEIIFTDNAYDENGLLRSNEQTITWSSGNDVIEAGTVVRGEFTSGPAVWSLGESLSGNVSLNGLAASGDNIFAYQSSSSCPSFIYGLSTQPWISSGSVNTNNSYLPSELNVAFGNISTGDNGNFEYTGTRQCFDNINDYRTSIHNLSNWSTVSGDLNSQRFVFNNEIEIIGESFMLLCGSSTSTLGFNSTTPPVSVEWFRNNQPFSNSTSIIVNKWSNGNFYAIATFCNGDVIQTDVFTINTIKVLTDNGNNAHYSKVCLNQNTTFTAPELLNATYQWRTRPNGTLVSTDREYTFTGFSGSFDVFVTSPTGCTKSTRVRVLAENERNCETPEDFTREENYAKTAFSTSENNTTFFFYPNPVNNNYAIQISGLETDQIFSVEWIDITGKKVAQTTASTGSGTVFNHSVSGIPSGLYFVNVKNQNHNFTLKVMVK